MSDHPFFSTQNRHRLTSGCLSSRWILSLRMESLGWSHTGHSGVNGEEVRRPGEGEGELVVAAMSEEDEDDRSQYRRHS